MAGTSGTTGTHEELRFAVVLNGGVSLAVWMGGVVHELDQLSRDAGVYGRLTRALGGVKARADVITGSSAGGINGAALALAQVNRHADLSVLRDLWTEQGRFETLLQRPFVGQPSSLLRGDEYFLPQLRGAMRRLASPWEPYPEQERPIDLTITTTLLTGAQQVTADSFAQLLPQDRHDGRFRFFRGLDAAEKPVDHFTCPEEVTAALGLAARCSASFPVAFEPSFVPVHHPDHASYPANGLRPDMGRYASWTRPEATDDASRFAVDGGLLANTPTREALAAVARMPAAAHVQRVMLLVYPHAPRPGEERPDQVDRPPTVTRSAADMLGALTGEGSRTCVDEVEAHNRRAATRRGTRSDVLLAMKDVALRPLAETLYAHYRQLRIQRAARDFADRLDVATTHPFEQVRGDALAAQRRWSDEEPVAVPFVPARLPDLPGPATAPPARRGWAWGTTTALDLADIVLEVLAGLDDVNPRVRRRLDVDAQRARVHQATSVLRAARQDVDDAWAAVPVLGEVEPDVDYWLLRLDHYAELMPADPPRRLRRTLTLRQAAGRVGAPQTCELSVADLVTAATPRPGPAVAAAVDEVVSALARVLRAWTALPDGEQQCVRSALGPWAELVEPGWLAGTDRELEACLLTGLLDLHVVTWTIGDDDATESTQPLGLVQVSAQVEHPWAHVSRTLDDKLGGASLARFSGFLKASWRVNDWTWGRLDASAMLMRVLVTPDRVRRVCGRPGLLPAAGGGRERLAAAVVTALLREALRDLGGPAGAAGPDDLLRDPLLRSLHEEAVSEVVLTLSTDRGTGPHALPALAGLLAVCRQLEVIAVELPALASAVLADRSDGANGRSRGELLLLRHEALIARLADPDPPREGLVASGLAALDAFDRAGIGREPLERELASDQMIRTTMSTVGVAATLLDSPGAGLGRVNPATRVVKGALRIPYWCTLGLTAGGRLAAFLAVLALAVGGALVALSLLGLLEGALAGVAAATGAGLALTGFAYGALRTGSSLHGLVLLSAAVPLGVQGFVRARSEEDLSAGTGPVGLSAAVAVVLLVVGLAVLGSLPTPLRSPLAAATGRAGRAATWCGGAVRRTRWRWTYSRSPQGGGGRDQLPLVRWLVALVVLVGVGTSLGGGVPDLPTLPGLDEAVLDGRDALPVAMSLGLIALSGLLALTQGWRLRLWSWGPVSPGSDRLGWRTLQVSQPAGVTAGWAVVYGAGYLLLENVLSRVAVDPQWVVLCRLAALPLLLVVPWAAPYLATRRFQRRLLDRARAGDHRPPLRDHRGRDVAADPQAALLAWLVAHDQAFRWAVRRRWTSPGTVVLTARGRTLALKVDVALGEARRATARTARAGRPDPATAPARPLRLRWAERVDRARESLASRLRRHRPRPDHAPG